MANKAQPKKVIPPSSPFRFIPIASAPQLVFGGSKRESVYLKALQELLQHPDQLMEVDSLTARGGITAQAKKHAISVVFAEHAGKLYVKVLGQDSPEALVLRALEEEPLPMVEIRKLLDKPFPLVKAEDVTQSLSNSNKIQLRTETGGLKRWHKLPEAARASA